ncbi:phage head morphogenesis protein [Oceanobacillus luteolus]|uniref:phage head morphogenesis protein n=1 Tax=Oceanobacillus luteolus TaxID=1274358 RepID=UPI0020414844|nr:phage minor head protein [Oceanobacillus luteolus]MCM3739226.1 phage head morphogenesis protein [Oceanobacillus luteolus]
MTKPNKEQKERAAALDKLEKQFEKELIHNYQVALKEIRARIAFSYEKYDGNWIEMNRYNRLTKLEKEIAEEIRKLTGKNAQTLIRGMMDLFEESYYRTAYVLTNAVNSDLGFVLLDRELVRKAIENPLDRVGFLQRNRDNQARLTRQLREQLTQSLIQGEAYRTAAKRIKNRMDVGATNILRITRTEMHQTRQRSKLEGMKEGAERGILLKKHWLATIDNRTRDRHGKLDGVQVDLDEQFEIDGFKAEGPGLFGVAEMDIQCRCDVLEVVDGFEPRYRRVKGVGIVRYSTYEEFKRTGLKYQKVHN